MVEAVVLEEFLFEELSLLVEVVFLDFSHEV